MIRQCCNTYNLKFKPVTHVIFDLDGTLIDSEKVYGETLQKTVENFDRTYPRDLGPVITGSTQKDIAKYVIELLNIDTTIDDFLKFYNTYSSARLSSFQLMPGAEKLVRHLAKNNIPIAVATSSQSETVTLKTEKFKDLFSLFHHIVCGGTDPDVKAGKPAPDIFLICASRFDDSPDPSKCLVFEDSANGVKAALAAGMQVVMTPEEYITYEIWKTATLRLDSMEYFMPGLFGLPPYPPDESTGESTVFAEVFAENLEIPPDTTIMAGFNEEHVLEE